MYAVKYLCLSFVHTLLFYHMRKLLIILVFFVFSPSISVKSCELAKSYFIRSFNSTNGLSNNGVRCFVQDYEGYLWIGTEDGLNRFDGKTFKIYRNNPYDKSTISNNSIITVYEDNQHVLWVGTKGGGLCRYDRKRDNFELIGSKSTNQTEFLYSQVSAIYKDKENNLWVGTDGTGFYCYNIKIDHLTRFLHNPQKTNSISSNRILNIFEDENQQLWLGTWNGGICVFNKKTGVVKNILYQPSKNDGIGTNLIRHLTRDDKGNFWIAAFGKYAQQYNPKLDKFITYTTLPDGTKNYLVYAIMQGSDNGIWLATNKGVYRSFNNLPSQEFTIPDKFELQHSALACAFYEDRSGSVWVATRDKGLLQVLPREKRFDVHLIEFLKDKNPWLNNRVASFSEDLNGNILIANEGHMIVYDQNKDTYTELQSAFDLKIHSFIRSFCHTSSGRLFVGGATGMWEFNYVTGKLDIPISLGLAKNSASRDDIFQVIEKNKNELWLGTDNGLYSYNLITGKSTSYISDTDMVEGHALWSIRTLKNDSRGDLLIGTLGGGLIILDHETNKFQYFFNKREEPKSISSNYVNCIHISSTGNVWLATNNGLDFFDRKSNSFTFYDSKDGLPGDMLYGILEDNKGNLWMNSNTGLSKFNIKNKKFTNYFLNDQFRYGSFMLNSCYKDRHGVLYFGRMDSYVSFNPDSIKDEMIEPQTVLTDFKIFNKSIIYKDNPVLFRDFTQDRKVNLSYNQSSFSFEFAVVNFINSENNLFKYKLENFDHEWFNSGISNVANYTNIPPGKYVFHVKACSADGLWNSKDVLVNIVISPPFWMTWQFKLAITLLILFSLGAFYKMRLFRLEQLQKKLQKQVKQRTSELSESNFLLEEQKEELQLQKEILIAHHDSMQEANNKLELQKCEIELQNTELYHHRIHLEEIVTQRTEELLKEKRHAEEADQLKSAFLANMSHEIRTPLNAIVGFSTMLNKKNLRDEQKTSFINIINSSSESLLVLIDDILDLSRIEAGQLHIKKENFQVLDVVYELVELFEQRNTNKNLRICINESYFDNNLSIYSDRIRFKQIYTNLMSNAMKFTQQGFLEFGCESIGNDEMKFYLKDTGIGIAPENLKTIFDRFIKVENTHKFYSGTGLGLAISQRLTELLGGKIWVDSELNKGSTFNFTQKL